MAYVSEFLCGDMTSVSGGQLSTVINERPLPLGAVMGHDHAEVSDVYEAVTNDDYAAFSATFENGAGAIEVSRVAAGHANSLIFEVFCENGAASFDQRRPSEIQLFLREGKSAQAGYRQIILGPEHPYLSGGLAMDAPSVGFGQNDAFAYQARAFLEEVAGIDEASSLPRCATFDEGVHNMELLAAVAESAANGGDRRHRCPAAATPARPQDKGVRMKLGVYNAILHDRPPARGPQGHRRSRPDRHRDQLRRLPAAGAHPDLRRHPGQRHRPRRLPRHLRGHRGRRSPG